MVGRRGILFWVVLLLAAMSVSLVAWGEITLNKDGTSQANWWSEDDHDEVCGVGGPDYCNVADHWSIELGTHTADDWAYMSLACSTKERDPAKESRTFTVQEIDDAQFTYKMFGPPAPTADSGPAMAFALYDRATNTNHLMISVPAPVQTAACVLYDAFSANWWHGTWDGTKIDSFVVDPGLVAPVALAAVPDYEVHAALVVMGMVGNTLPGGALIGEGKTVIDDVILEWTNGDTGTAYGGLYRIEPAWPDRFGFEDWPIVPGVDELPRQFDRWCTCAHCMPADDLNLWFYPNDAPVFAENVPETWATTHGVLEGGTFQGQPDNDYAIYFGNDAYGADAWDYNVGEVAVGCICSPFNELNPGDRFVSIGFDYLREVEQYIDGEYDWTYVQVKFFDGNGNAEWVNVATQHDGYDPTAVANENPGDTFRIPPADCINDWKTVWYKDSSDPNETGWQHADITHYLDAANDVLTGPEFRIQVPPEATRMRIRFCFNSRDGAQNHFLGWFVDNIVKQHSPDPVGCEIDVETLPQGEMEDKYPAPVGVVDNDGGVQLEPHGEGYNWSVVGVWKDGEVLAGLPQRLALTADGLLYGECEPGTAGTYTIRLRLDCRAGFQEKDFTLVIRSPQNPVAGNLIASEDFEAPQTFLAEGVNLPPGPGTCPQPAPFGANLWHQTGKVKYAFDDPAQMAEMGHVAYFGADDPGRPTKASDPHYCDSRVKGCMESRPGWAEVVNPDWDGEELVVGFKSWRQVEDYEGADYDKTWVAVRINDGSWQTIWFRSSADESLAKWTWQEVDTGIILHSGDKIRVRFCFDSVDGYKNGETGKAFGWLVDEVRLYAGSTTLKIVDCPPGEASVGEFYREEVRASGGPNVNYQWDVLPRPEALPAGLSLEVDGRNPRLAYITGVPREITGREPAEFTLRVRSPNGLQVATLECQMVVDQTVTLLTEDFEDDPSWSAGGLWHITGDGGVVGVNDLGQTNHAAYYGQDDAGTPNYDTNQRTTGSLTLVSPVVPMADVEAVRIDFDFWREVESFAQGGYDVVRLEVKFDDGEWLTKWSRDSGTPPLAEWTDTACEFETPEGAVQMLIRFVFDSIDKWYNDYVGWLVDNIKVTSISADSVDPMSMLRAGRAAPRSGPQELQVFNVPNPVKDVHTTTFMVRSVDVEAMRIAIYDIAQTLVFEREIAGNELEWHTDNDYGEYLANGVYIYRAYVLIDGAWIETKAQKLVILR